MKVKLRKSGIANTFLAIIGIALVLSVFLTAVGAEPSGPTISIVGNTTNAAAGGAKVNSSNATNSVTRSPGGMIFTANLQSDQQNTRWKAYVGNVTGTLTLDDANSNTIYQWTLSTVTGEVYAARTSGSINWSGINCTWIADGIYNVSANASSNRTPEHNENIVLSHTSPDDNITATFAQIKHSSMTIGSVIIGKDECFSIQTWQNDTAQAFTDSDTANFTEMILYDGAFNKTTGNIVYATFIENNLMGYNGDQTYDFQMILPESAAVGFTSSTAYYFYVELS